MDFSWYKTMPGLLWWEYVGSSRRMKELIPLSWTKFNRKPLEGVLQAAPQIVQELSDAQLQIKSVHQCCQGCIQAPAGQKLLNTIFKTSLPHNFSVIFDIFIFYKKMWHPFVHLFTFAYLRPGGSSSLSRPPSPLPPPSSYFGEYIDIPRPAER